MFSVDVKPTLGTVNVQTTENKGLSPEYWTERLVEKLISISRPYGESPSRSV